MTPLRRRARPRGPLGAIGAGVLAALAACAPHLPRSDGHGPAGAGSGGAAETSLARAQEGELDGAGGARAGAALAHKNAKAPAPAASHAAPAEAGPPVELVTIRVLVEPPQRAHVVWGAKDFGLAPLDIRRPRGSGPLDLLLRAPGFLTLHTRAFTERDNTLSVHLVPESEASRFPGYQSSAATVTEKAPALAASRHTGARTARPAKPTAASVTPPAPHSDATTDEAPAP